MDVYEPWDGTKLVMVFLCVQKFVLLKSYDRKLWLQSYSNFQGSKIHMAHMHNVLWDHFVNYFCGHGKIHFISQAGLPANCMVDVRWWSIFKYSLCIHRTHLKIHPMTAKSWARIVSSTNLDFTENPEMWQTILILVGHQRKDVCGRSSDSEKEPGDRAPHMWQVSIWFL